MTLPLSVVIPSHNRADLLRACLASVTLHAPAGTEILVVDDASPDGSVPRIAAEFADVLCLRLARHSGFCVAANEGIRAASNPIVELLNDDTEVTAGWADAALACFADRAVAAVAPLVLRWQADNEATPTVDSAGDRYYVGGVAGKRGHGQPLGPEHLRGGRVFGASASSAFYRREAVLEVGCFPEEFGAYFEDVDLAFRLHWAGWEVVYEPASRVLHHVSASHGVASRRLLQQQSRNEERIFWRNLPRGVLWRSLAKHSTVLVAKAWRRLREGNLLPFVCGRLEVLKEVEAIRRHRRKLEKMKRDDGNGDWRLETHYLAAEQRC